MSWPKLWIDWPDFSLSGPWIGSVRLWNLFNRPVSTGGKAWGFGILQVGNRHLIFIGFFGMRVLFLGRSPKQ